MSLEKEISGLAAAVRELVSVLTHRTVTAPVADTSSVTVSVAPVVPVAPIDLMTAMETLGLTIGAAPEIKYDMPPLEPREVVAEPAEPAEQPAEVAYADVAKAITTVFLVDRQKVIAVLAKFGAKKGPELKKADYVAFLAELG
jgi:hypothetical protein